MEKLNLKSVSIKEIDGSVREVDFDFQGLANYIYNQTRDIGELELARELYQMGEVALDSGGANAIKGYIQQAFNAVVQEALNPLLDKIINSK